MWWEMNKFDFLVPRRRWNEAPITPGGAPSDDVLGTEPAGNGASARPSEEARLALVRRLEGLLDHRDYNVRASTLLALARLRVDVDAAREGLLDPHAQVRDAALLSFGLAGRTDSIPDLLRISWDRPEARRALGLSDEVPSRTRALALAALGIARARSAPDRASELARAWLRDPSIPRRRETATAAAVALTLAADASTGPDLVAVARDPQEPTELRVRALTALGALGDPSARETVAAALEDPDLEVRRAGAIALGGLAAAADAEATERLREFLRREKDPTTSGFGLVALGRIGGAGARDECLRELVRGKAARRPWAAIGLALATRTAHDPEARSRLRDAFLEEKSADRRGAYAIALGILQDRDAQGTILEAFEAEKEPRLRGQLAHALALLRTSEAREALLAAAGAEKSPYVRGTAAFALGFYADPRDVGVLAQALRSNTIPGLMGMYSLALGFHGAGGALDPLFAVIADPAAPDAAVAAAIDAAALLFEEDPVPILHRVARESNYLADPEIVVELLKFLV
jgi:HEAT repeat protein